MLTAREIFKFSVLVALFGILSDAVLGHALLWENDPYWTYWITKTFLIGTVFALGTVWIGIGAIKGAIITLVHTLILTIYYWSFSPIGLPDAPQWLDLEHTWITGVPIHFTVIYIGYVAALWIWRSSGKQDMDGLVSIAPVVRLLTFTVIAVVTSGVLSSLVLGEFVGVTWFVTRVLIVFPLFLFWHAYIPHKFSSVFVGGFTIALSLVAYSHYLSPLGLPGTWRVFEEASPITNPRWLGYEELWLMQFPIYLIVFIATLWLAFSVARPKHRL